MQQFFGDGACNLHTRSLKYGKLRNGFLVTVPSALIKRSKSHFISLPGNVDVLLGMNGNIWVSMHVDLNPDLINQPEGLYSNENDEISVKIRDSISRTCNCIKILASGNCRISEATISLALDLASNMDTFDILNKTKSHFIIVAAKKVLKEASSDN